MDPQLEGRLRAIELKVEENNKILVRMRRVQRNATLVRAMYWIILIIIAIGSYYFIKPYISQLGAAYGLTSDTENKSDRTSASNLLKQLEEFQKGQQ